MRVHFTGEKEGQTRVIESKRVPKACRDFFGTAQQQLPKPSQAGKFLPSMKKCIPQVRPLVQENEKQLPKKARYELEF
jgi:hypothetical protein